MEIGCSCASSFNTLRNITDVVKVGCPGGDKGQPCLTPEVKRHGAQACSTRTKSVPINQEILIIFIQLFEYIEKMIGKVTLLLRKGVRSHGACSKFAQHLSGVSVCKEAARCCSLESPKLRIKDHVVVYVSDFSCAQQVWNSSLSAIILLTFSLLDLSFFSAAVLLSVYVFPSPHSQVLKPDALSNPPDLH
eukprot:scaffold6917_cov19-Tisochrysis_lutea.AAC.1